MGVIVVPFAAGLLFASGALVGAVQQAMNAWGASRSLAIAMTMSVGVLLLLVNLMINGILFWIVWSAALRAAIRVRGPVNVKLDGAV